MATITLFNPLTDEIFPVNTAGFDVRYVNTAGDTMTGNLTVQPAVNSVTALRVNQADGTNILVVDTINKAFEIIGATSLIADTATSIPLLVKGAAGQTANLQEWQDSAGNVIGTIKDSGRFTVTTPGYTVYNETFVAVFGYARLSGLGSYTQRAASFQAYHLAGGNSLLTVQAFHGDARKRGAGNLSNLYGFVGEINHEGTGTLGKLKGVTLKTKNTSTGTISNLYGIEVDAPTNTGGGTVINAYGIYLGNVNIGSTLNYAVYTNAGIVYFGDQVGIGATTPATSAKLELSSTTGALLLTRMTTVQRDALTAVNGMVLYNTNNNRLEAYENGAWVDL